MARRSCTSENWNDMHGQLPLMKFNTLRVEQSGRHIEEVDMFNLLEAIPAELPELPMRYMLSWQPLKQCTTKHPTRT